MLSIQMQCKRLTSSWQKLQGSPLHFRGMIESAFHSHPSVWQCAFGWQCHFHLNKGWHKLITVSILSLKSICHYVTTPKVISRDSWGCSPFKCIGNDLSQEMTSMTVCADGNAIFILYYWILSVAWWRNDRIGILNRNPFRSSVVEVKIVVT